MSLFYGVFEVQQRESNISSIKLKQTHTVVKLFLKY